MYGALFQGNADTMVAQSAMLHNKIKALEQRLQQSACQVGEEEKGFKLKAASFLPEPSPQQRD